MRSVMDPGVQRRELGRLILVTVLLVAIIVSSFLAVRKFLETEEVLLPSVVGMDLRDAVRVLRVAQLEVGTYPEAVPEVAPNQVTSQSPFPESVVRPGRIISLGVNTPPEAFPVPHIVGLGLDEAKRRAVVVNMDFSEVRYSYSDVPIGRVISQAPIGGDYLDGLDGLFLLVSRGQEPMTLPVPDFDGTPIDQAVNELKGLGFRRVETVPSSLNLDQSGVVHFQRPESGANVPISTPILLGYSLSGDQIVQIPDLREFGVEQAQRMLRSVGLGLGEVKLVDEVGKARNVLFSEPGGYTLRGSIVNLLFNGAKDASRVGYSTDPTVSTNTEVLEESARGPHLDRREIPFTFDSPKLGLNREFDLLLVAIDNNGERTVLNQRVKPDEVVSTVIIVIGYAQLQTFIDGQFYQAWSP